MWFGNLKSAKTVALHIVIDALLNIVKQTEIAKIV